jgi:ceramide synthetase
MEYLMSSPFGCLAHQLLGSGDASFFEKDVFIYTGHVVPHGYYKLHPRDTHIADAAFYYRVIGFAVFFTLMRLAVKRYLVQPLEKPLLIAKAKSIKLEEAIMQVCFYTWSVGYNLTFSTKQDWFWHPIICFLDAFPRSVLEPEISFFYSAQIGWYLHGVYTHFFLDTKKSDFAIMIVHHVVTLSLLYGAFIYGYFRIGMLVTFSMDVCDIFLYSAQILKIVKSGGQIDYPKAVYYVGFGMIPISWFFARLVYFPTVLMRTTFLDSICSSGYANADGWAFFNLLLGILLGLNTWWFWIIVKIALASATSKNLQALDDIRDKDAAEGFNKEAADKKNPRETRSKVPKKTD